jgi:phosphoglycolate phosphatase
LVDTAPDLAYALNALLLENGIEEKSYKLIKPLVAHGGKALITMGFPIINDLNFQVYW